MWIFWQARGRHGRQELLEGSIWRSGANAYPFRQVLARRLGQRVGVTYGEGFVLREPMILDDLAGLRVSSF